jgi:hypothetical protein
MANQSPKKSGKSRLSMIRNVKSEDANNVADWGTITPSILIDLVQVVAAAGGATRFGYTRDGGAYSVGIYLDDDRETFYFKPADDIDDAISQLTEMLRNV